MELTDWVLIGLISAVFCATFSVIGAYATLLFRDYRVSRLENTVEKLVAGQYSVMGNQKKVEKAERMQTAMLEVAAIMKNAEITDKQGAIMQLAMKYPDIALDLIKKGI